MGATLPSDGDNFFIYAGCETDLGGEVGGVSTGRLQPLPTNRLRRPSRRLSCKLEPKPSAPFLITVPQRVVCLRERLAESLAGESSVENAVPCFL